MKKSLLYMTAVGIILFLLRGAFNESVYYVLYYSSLVVLTLSFIISLFLFKEKAFQINLFVITLFCITITVTDTQINFNKIENIDTKNDTKVSVKELDSSTISIDSLDTENDSSIIEVSPSEENPFKFVESK